MTEPVRVRAPATTANIGPGFDCAAAAFDLWNELSVSDGGEADRDHLGVRAFSLLADPSGFGFDFTVRIPRERGLGSSASIIALGLAAAMVIRGEQLD
ncbi:MAG: homoserine kinase, partial [Gaiellaceae bacterium]